MDERRFRLLPKHAGFVNMSRGEVVDEAALTLVLAGGHLRGAYLDVFTHEPLTSESPLWTMPNVLITPHNSSTGTGNYRRGVEIFLRNLEAYLRGEAVLENEVGAIAPVQDVVTLARRAFEVRLCSGLIVGPDEYVDDVLTMPVYERRNRPLVDVVEAGADERKSCTGQVVRRW